MHRCICTVVYAPLYYAPLYMHRCICTVVYAPLYMHRCIMHRCICTVVYAPLYMHRICTVVSAPLYKHRICTVVSAPLYTHHCCICCICTVVYTPLYLYIYAPYIHRCIVCVLVMQPHRWLCCYSGLRGEWNYVYKNTSNIRRPPQRFPDINYDWLWNTTTHRQDPALSVLYKICIFFIWVSPPWLCHHVIRVDGWIDAT